MLIRPYRESDADPVWDIFHEVVQGGDTYSFLPDTSREEAIDYFTGHNNKCFVAEYEGKVAGMYALRPNRRGLGSHVANASYMVSKIFKGKGIGKALGLHSLEQARKEGYSAMQFNFVVSTNIPAVNLWKSLGFNIIGTIPEGFNHSELGFVDAYIMHREL